MLFATAMSFASRGEYLWWSLEDPDVTINKGAPNQEVTNTEMFWYDDPQSGQRLWVTDARVHVKGPNGVDEYLMIGATGTSKTFPSVSFMDPDTHEIILPTYTGDVFAMIVPDSYADAAYSFQIELGNWLDQSSEQNWTMMAESGYISYDKLAEYIAEEHVDEPPAWIWTPEVMTGRPGSAPEPTSGMLMLIGFSFLALRRRRIAA